MPVQGPPEERRVPDSAEPIAILQRDWTVIAGPALSKNSQPLKLLHTASAGTLLIGVSSSVWANEIEYSKMKILEKIASRFEELHLPPLRLTEIRFQISTRSSART